MPGALVLSSDGTLMPSAPLAKASWHGSWPPRAGEATSLLAEAKEQVLFYVQTQQLGWPSGCPARLAQDTTPGHLGPVGLGQGSERGWQEVPRSSQSGRGTKVLK